jgi:hypothetical protein
MAGPRQSEQGGDYGVWQCALIGAKQGGGHGENGSRRHRLGLATAACSLALWTSMSTKLC